MDGRNRGCFWATVWHKKADTLRYPFLFFLFGRDERIRTSDFLHPMQALYQAELRPEYEIKNNTFFQQMQAVSDFLSCFVSFALGSAQQLRFGHSFCNFCLAPLPRACKITKLRLSSEKLPPEVFPSSSPMQALYQAELRPETVNTAFITKIVFSQSYFSLFCRKICFCPDGASFERFRLRAAQLFFLTFPLAKRRKICQSGKTYHKL